MDELNRRPTLPHVAASELTAEGLVLWHLSAEGQSDLWCLVFEFPDAIYFVVEDDPHGVRPSLVTERHADICTLVDRAQELKYTLLKCGWSESEAE
jgi:hypothetical protein